MDTLLKILFVEDSVADFDLIQRHLEKSGLAAACRRVASREELESALAQGGWDFVLSDYNVPGLPFDETLRLLKPTLEEIPVILVSGSVGEERAVELLREGVWNFVLKDNLSRLVPAIERGLRSAADRAARRQAEAAQRESERLRQAIMDLVPHFIFVKDRASRHLYVNRACAAANGLTPQQMTGKNDLELVADQAQALRFMRDDQEVIESGQPKFIPEESLKDFRGVRRVLQTYKIPFAALDQQPAVLGVAVDITDLKHAEAALVESENRFRQMTACVTDVLYGVDAASLEFSYLSPAFERMFGYTKEDIVRLGGREKFLAAVIAVGDFEPQRQRFVDLQRSASTAPVVWEAGWRCRDGSIKVVEDRAIPIYDGGRLVATYGVLRDITARKQAEAALRQSEEQFRAMFELASIGMVQADPHTRRLLRVNRKFCELTGYAAKELLQMDLLALTHPADRPAELALFGQVVRGELPHYQLEERYVRQDGAEAWVSVNMTVLREDAATPSHTMTTVEDITGRKRAEQTLQLQGAALAAAANAIVITDSAGHIEWTNQTFTTLPGYSAAEAAGRNPRLLKSGQQDTAFYRDLWDTILAGHIWHGELVNRRKDGTFYDEDMTITPLLDAGGQVAHFIAIKQDITERKRLEAQLVQSQKMEAIGTLAGGVAHDFNNILTSMFMQVELAKLEPNLSADLRENLQQIRSDADRAASLTRQLLLFSRRQAKQSRVLDLNDIVTNLMKMLQRIIGEDVRLQLHLHPRPLFTVADAGMLEQVLMNLSVNARDAMPAGGVLTIGTSEARLEAAGPPHPMRAAPGSYACLSVADTGTGIPPEIMPRLFDPFFTTKEPGKGTGLGLATVFGIVNQHHGWVQVDSPPGEGATFKVFLPTASEGETRAATPEPEMMLAGTETILLVEDEEPVRRSTRSLLVHQGYQVLEAANGLEALQLWKAKRPKVDLLLTDIVMPAGVSGLQLARELQADEPGLKVIYASGYSADIAGKELDSGMEEHFLQKPFTPEQLFKMVRRLIDG